MNKFETALIELHTEAVKKLIERIQEDECPAAVIKEAREMLRDNRIDLAHPFLKGTPMANLATVLPFTDDDGDVAVEN